MTAASKEMILAIQHVVKHISIGTNLSLLNILWAMVSGAFLSSRGTVHLALKISGCTDDEIRRASNALRTGQWQISELITSWRQYVHEETQWERRDYEGWYAVSADVVVFPRPKLKGWAGKLYRGTFGRAVKAIGLGTIVDIGQYKGERVALLRKIVRSRNSDKCEKLLKQDLLKASANLLQPDEAFIHDAGVKIKDMRDADIKNFIIRLSRNCVARRNFLPDDAHGNRKYGKEIRPLSRVRKGKLIEATGAPDFQTSFLWQGRQIEAKCWRDVVGFEDKVLDNAQPYDIWAFFDPCFKQPWLIGTTIKVSAKTVFQLYVDRWPVEQTPLAAKQRVGMQRQYVWKPECCWRLPELGMLAGNMLTHLAYELPPMPTGYWDRNPKKTPGRLQQVLREAGRPQFFQYDPRIRPKAAISAHLPKGIEAHRRKKATMVGEFSEN